MSDLILQPTWEPSIRQLERTDLVGGGVDGVDNIAPRQLGNRTEWLMRRIQQMTLPGTDTTVFGLRLPAPILELSSDTDLGWDMPIGNAPPYAGWMYYAPLTSSSRKWLTFPVPTLSGRIVGASMRCLFMGASAPSSRARLVIGRTVVDSNSWSSSEVAAVTDGAAVYAGTRTLTVSGANAAIDLVSQYYVAVQAPYNATDISGHGMAVLSPIVYLSVV